MSRFGNFNYFTGSDAEIEVEVEADASENMASSANGVVADVEFLGVQSPRRGELVSLLCPLSGKRLQDPVRGRNCKHLRAFDKHTFLSAKSYSTFFGPQNKHNCPICLGEIQDNLSLVPADDIIRCLQQTDDNEVTVAFLQKLSKVRASGAREESPQSQMSFQSDDNAKDPARPDTKIVSPHSAKYGNPDDIETSPPPPDDSLVPYRQHVEYLVHINSLRTKSKEIRWLPCRLVLKYAKWQQRMLGITIHFPFKKPLVPQIQMMQKLVKCLKEKKHGLLESPTGTGKTAALLCSSLAWQRHNDEAGWKINNGNPIRIYFCTRTHSQVKQISKGLKATAYRPNMTVLGSRNQLCINPDVNAPDKATAGISALCAQKIAHRECHYHKSLTEYDYAEKVTRELRPKDVEEHLDSIDACDDPGGVIDIEDLRVFGEEETGCSFYSARALAETSQLILCPYNYIFDPSIREAVISGSLENSVVIVDEAHNVEQVLLDSGSTGESLFDLMTITKDLCVIHSFTNWKVELKDGRVIRMREAAGNLILIMERIIKRMQEKQDQFEATRAEREIKKMGRFQRGNKVIVSAYGGSATKTKTKPTPPPLIQRLNEEINVLLINRGISEREREEKMSAAKRALESAKKEYDDFFHRNAIARRFFDEFNISKEDIDVAVGSMLDLREGFDQENRKQFSDKPLHIKSLTENLPKLVSCLKFLWKHPYEYYVVMETCLNLDEETPPFHGVSDFGNQRLCCRALGTGYKHGKYLDPPQKDPPTWLPSLGIWLMTPAVMFEEIAASTHALVLTSGTLFPLSPKDFGETFTNRLACESQFNHVVKKDQVFISSIMSSPTGHLLDGSYRNIASMKRGMYELYVGATILQMLQRGVQERGGAIVFVPSYSKLSNFEYFWKTERLLANFEENRGPVIFEPKDGGNAAFELAKAEFVEYVDSGQSPTIVAVYRGKMSEGVDFKDAYCRAVFCVGIPFPSAKDNRINYKKTWNDSMHKCDPKFPSGDLWYRQQAYRALNQALGRCIRHKNDFGAVFLVDNRFAQTNSFGRALGPRALIAKWTQKLFRDDAEGGFVQLAMDVRSFFLSIPHSIRLGEEREDPKTPVAARQASQMSIEYTSSPLKRGFGQSSADQSKRQRGLNL